MECILIFIRSKKKLITELCTLFYNSYSFLCVILIRFFSVERSFNVAKWYLIDLYMSDYAHKIFNKIHKIIGGTIGRVIEAGLYYQDGWCMIEEAQVVFC